MEVELTPEQEAKLSRIASTVGTKTDRPTAGGLLSAVIDSDFEAWAARSALHTLISTWGKRKIDGYIRNELSDVIVDQSDGGVCDPLLSGKLAPIVGGMEVPFTPEQEAQLSQITSTVGTKAEELVKNAALHLLDDEVRFHGANREGIAQTDRGEFIEEDEMGVRFEKMLRS